MSQDKTEQDIKGYDPVILKKIFMFIRPYRLIAVIAVLALFFATAAEIAIPLLLQRTIDTHILNYWVLVPQKVVGNETVFIQNQSFIRKNEAKKLGYATNEAYYLFEVNKIPPELPAGIQNKLIKDNEQAAILLEDLRGLPQKQKAFITSQDKKGISRATLLFLLLLLCSLVFSFIQIYLMALTSQNVMKDIRQKLFSNLIRQSLSWLGNTPVGKLVSALSNDVETINELFTSVFISFLKDISIMIGVLIAFFVLDVRLGLITLATLPPVVLLSLIFRQYSRKAYRNLRKCVAKVNTFLSEHIAGMSVVQMFAKEIRTAGEFDKDNHQLLKANLSEMYVFATFRPLIDLLAYSSVAVVIYFGAGFNKSGLVSLGVLFAFINLIEKFYDPIKDMSEKFNIMQSAMAGGERVFHFMELKNVIKDDSAEQKLNLSDFKGHIDFEKVCFAYKEDEPVLRNLSFTVEPGERIAIVGYTGAGKTTIINLITRLWDIQSGNISIDGLPIKSIPLSQLRTLVQPVIQDVFLFSGTVRENIALGRDFSQEEIEEAAKVVYAHDFILGMEKGYDTLLNEGATNISAGERQLLSFARVIAHNPGIILLDEATANIDTETESWIQKALDRLLEGRTSIVIAHRLSTIRNADRILVLKQGEMVETGNHEQLLEKRGLYHTLYELQYVQSAN
ncbi:MAG: ABC transporter ATP-binding protein/permease [Spirochaetes bacterium]|nr:ABC transporter ATP-binding protein/permease [Spirochaetota bacterium]